MRRIGWIVAGGMLAGAAGAAERGSTRELDVAGNATTPTSVAGVPARLRIAPDAFGAPVVGPALAARAGLKGGLFEVVYVIGPVRVPGETAVTRIALGGEPVKRRVAWTARDFAPGADVFVGPGGVPDPVVRFRLRAERAGERVLTLPMIGEGGLFGDRGGLFASAPLNGAPVRLRFSLDLPATLANAGAARSLMEAHDGRLEEGTGSAAIAFGVARPVRRMRLSRPFAIGPLAIGALDVRVADGASGPPEAGVADPNEVVVTAKGARDRRRDTITLGRDQLDRCSSLVFDKSARQVRLSCLQGAAP